MSSRAAGDVLPDFLVIGAMKSATSSLHEYLALHPDVAMSRPKEPAFFADDGKWARGLDWYREHFTSKPGSHHAGDVSPHYAMRHNFPHTVERIHATVPHARFVYLVRDPLARIESGWVHSVANGRSTSFTEAVGDPSTSPPVQTSRYHWQLEPYLERWGADRILVVQTERLAADPATVVGEVLRFIGADDRAVSGMGLGHRFHESSEKRRPNAIGRLFWHHPAFRRRALRRVPWLVGRRIEPPRWDPSVRARVEDYLRDDVAALREFTGQTFEGWSI